MCIVLHCFMHSSCCVYALICAVISTEHALLPTLALKLGFSPSLSSHFVVVVKMF